MEYEKMLYMPASEVSLHNVFSIFMYLYLLENIAADVAHYVANSW